MTQVSVRSVGKDALLYVPGRVIPAVVQILTVPVLTGYFSSGDFGRFNLTFRFILFLSTFTILWLNMAILRFYATYSVRDQEAIFFGVIGFLRYAAIGLGLVLGVLAYTAGPERMFGSYRDQIFVGLLVFVFYSVYETGLAVLRAKRKPLTYSAATTICAGLRLPLAIGLFVWFQMGVSGMWWAMAATYAIAYVAMVGRHIGRPHWPIGEKYDGLMREVLAYGLPIWLTQVLSFLIVNSDLYLLKMLQGASGDVQAGLYSAATNLVDQPMVLVFNTFSMAVFPSIALAWETQDREVTENLVRGVTRIYFQLCVPLMVFLTVLAVPIFRLLARGETYQAYTAAPWIAGASFLFGLSYFASFGLHLAKRTVALMLVTVVALGVNVGLNFVCIPAWGFVGAGVARLAANGVLVAAIAAAGHHYFRWRFPGWSLVKITASALLAAAPLWYLQGRLPQNVYTLMLLFGIGGMLYGAFLLASGEVPWSMVIEIASRMRRRSAA